MDHPTKTSATILLNDGSFALRRTVDERLGGLTSLDIGQERGSGVTVLIADNEGAAEKLRKLAVDALLLAAVIEGKVQWAPPLPIEAPVAAETPAAPARDRPQHRLLMSTPAEQDADQAVAEMAANRAKAPRTAYLYDRVNTRLYGPDAGPLTSEQRLRLEELDLSLGAMLDNGHNAIETTARVVLNFVEATES